MKGDLRYKKAVEYAELKSDSKILDLGAGDFNLLVHFPFHENYKNYIPIDINEKAMIKYDLNNGLPEDLGKFDAIFLLELLEYIPNYKKLLLDCKKHLKDGGKIIITTSSNNCFIRATDSTHCFRKAHLINLAKEIDMDCFITGVHLRIPKLNVFIPSKQMLYNDCFLMRLDLK